MKNNKAILSVVTLAALVLAAILIGNRLATTPDALMRNRESLEATQPSAPSSPHAAMPAITPDGAGRAPSRSIDLAEPSDESDQPIRLSVTQDLGSVNGTLIQLKHLVPILPGEKEKGMTIAEYRSRLERAIEAELMFQEARCQGVDLTPQQKERLDRLEQEEDSALQELHRKQGVTWSSFGAEEVEFEKQLLTAQMLQQNLVIKQAGVAPSPQHEVQFRYEEARRELLDKLQAGARITKAELPL
jgi:hypothetical protein